MKKRGFPLLLALLLLLSLLPLSVGAADLPFSDVTETHENYTAIQYVYENNLMNGVEGGKFAPDRTFTRAMFVTILGRMEGIDSAQYTGTPFSDVSAKDKSIAWAAPYIQWASENGIVNGVGNGKFAPNAPITKEQYCTIIHRYFISTEGTISADPPLFVYLADGGDLSDYAKESVRALVGYGLIDLCPGQLFYPQNAMTRGEITQTFSRVHALKTTGEIPQSLLTENTPYCIPFGLSVGAVGEFTELTGRQPVYTEFDYWFSIAHAGYTATGFHSGYDNSDYLYQVDIDQPGISTSRGISVGSTRAEVSAAYPGLSAAKLDSYEGDYLWYQEDGVEDTAWTLCFWFENGRVSRIIAENLFE